MKVLSGKYENFKLDILYEVVNWNFDGILHLLTQLQILDFLYVVCRNLILQCCLSLLFDFLQMFTTRHSFHRVSIYFN